MKADLLRQSVSDQMEGKSMNIYEPSKKDWKLFHERLPEWQKNYMAHLCDEYAAILTGKDRGSEAFWTIEKRIREDKKRPGVMANVTRSEMPWIILGLLQDEAITLSDLDGFSDDLRERMEFLMSR